MIPIRDHQGNANQSNKIPHLSEWANFRTLTTPKASGDGDLWELAPLLEGVQNGTAAWNTAQGFVMKPLLCTLTT